MKIARIWDKLGRFPAGYVQSFAHWTFEISYRQHTLGSFIIFSNKYHESISELSEDEIKELPQVMRYIENLYRRIPELKPDKFNYWQMGNKLKHLHFHGIPRYKKPRKFPGKIWEDATFGDPPIWSHKDESDKLVGLIRKLVVSYIDGGVK
ncbi:MAG: hypothetical protein QXP20_05465 [Candidatus Bathyarchaeia archaeon]